ncbi:MAG TPA: acylphosphatase [bacterium]|nr:acylphosphatase [bacterium]
MMVHIIVIGLVQGVGFRYFTFKRARELGVTGYVKNLPDGTVEIEAEGDRGQLEELIEALKVGPRSAVVNDLRVSWDISDEKYNQFRIEY